MRLSYSRKDYYEVVFDQTINTWIQCHINAFNYFAGVPKLVKLDNLKAAITKPGLYESTYQEQYKKFADHYGFWPAPCRVRKPQEKGKVESGIKYVCDNFFKGREFSSFNELESTLRNWLNYKCNDRIHGTTRKIPSEVFMQEESSTLQPLPKDLFDMSCWYIRKVGKDCHINLINNYYSVPAKYAFKEVGVAFGQKLVKIYYDDQEIAVHGVAIGKGKFITNKSHYPKGKLLYPESEEYKEQCMSNITALGEGGAKLLELLQSERTKDWQRIVKGVLSLRNTYSDEILNKVCTRAYSYGVSSYSKIKKIAENNCYDLPLPEENIGGENARID